MKKSTLITILCAVVMVPMVLLTLSIKENKAEQATINATPKIEKLEPRSAIWGKSYPRQFDSYMATKKSDEILDVLEEKPALVVM